MGNYGPPRNGGQVSRERAMAGKRDEVDKWFSGLERSDDRESSTVSCTCGSSISWKGFDDISEWQDKHFEHRVIVELTVFEKDRKEFPGEPTHHHICRVIRSTLDPITANPHSFVCFGTTDRACEHNRMIAEMGCLMEEDIRKHAGQDRLTLVLDKWEKEVNENYGKDNSGERKMDSAGA